MISKFKVDYCVCLIYQLRDLGLQVMKTLVQFGASPNILVDGKPHLGTDKLVPLLQSFRRHLTELGVSLSIHILIRLCVFLCSA
jgi:uncharacterized FAD-dependent dehydrogenase